MARFDIELGDIIPAAKKEDAFPVLGDTVISGVMDIPRQIVANSRKVITNLFYNSSIIHTDKALNILKKECARQRLCDNPNALPIQNIPSSPW